MWSDKLIKWNKKQKSWATATYKVSERFDKKIIETWSFRSEFWETVFVSDFIDSARKSWIFDSMHIMVHEISSSEFDKS